MKLFIMYSSTSWCGSLAYKYIP